MLEFRVAENRRLRGSMEILSKISGENPTSLKIRNFPYLTYMYAQYILEAGGNELQGQNIDYFKRKCNFMIDKHNSYKNEKW